MRRIKLCNIVTVKLAECTVVLPPSCDIKKESVNDSSRICVQGSFLDVLSTLFLQCRILWFMCITWFCAVSDLALFDHNRRRWTRNLADNRPIAYLF